MSSGMFDAVGNPLSVSEARELVNEASATRRFHALLAAWRGMFPNAEEKREVTIGCSDLEWVASRVGGLHVINMAALESLGQLDTGAVEKQCVQDREWVGEDMEAANRRRLASGVPEVYTSEQITEAWSKQRAENEKRRQAFRAYVEDEMSA